VSLGNLISYAFVNAAAVNLRFRSPQKGHRKKRVIRSPNEKYAWYYLASSFLFAISYGQEAHFII
jgi:hypothetical protein